MYKKIALIALLILAIAIPATAGHHEEKTEDPGWHGMFVWHELVTPDGAEATKFYTELFGWKTEVMDMGAAGPYTTWKQGETEVGGMLNMELPEGVHPHWMTYIAVDDIYASLKMVKELGGAVHFGPLPVEGIGDIAVCADPQGAAFSLMQFAQKFPYQAPKMIHRTFVGDNLMTSDVKAAQEFYGKLLGWTGETMDLGELGPYTTIMRGAQEAAGMIPMPEDAKTHPYWQSYVLVGSVEKFHAKAIELGGREYFPRTEIPGYGAFSCIGDPSGAALCLIEFKDVKKGCADLGCDDDDCSEDSDGGCSGCSDDKEEEVKEVKEVKEEGCSGPCGSH